MEMDSETFAASLFRYHPLTVLVGLLLCVLAVQVGFGVPYLMLLERTRWAVLLLGLLLASITLGGSALIRRLTAGRELLLPTVLLWLTPMAVLGGGYLGYFLLLVVLPDRLGRGFWSTLLQVNAKVSAITFTATFTGFLVFIGTLVLIETIRYMRWSLSMVEGMSRLAQEKGQDLADPAAKDRPERALALADEIGRLRGTFLSLEQARERAGRFNHRALLTAFGLFLIVCCWIIFLRPELILYYRGELQLRTFQSPEVALETFAHLTRRYPDYKYLDTVEFRLAWILDRRLGREAEAVTAYEAFLKKYRLDNVWADDALTNLIRLSVDKRRDFAKAREWIATYRQTFPEGVMAPHVALYEVRALRESGHEEEARQALAEARKRYGDRQIIVYNAEDDFQCRIPFEIVARSFDR